MDPVTLGLAAGSIGAPIIGGIMGKSSAKKAAGAAAAERAQAQANMEEAVRILEAIGIPSVEAQKIVLAQPELAGQLVAEQTGPSAFEQVSTDPRLEQAQKQALEGLRQRSVEGLTAEDLAKFEELRTGLKAQQQAQEAGILQSMAERGTLGSGQELAVRLNAAQQGNQSALNQGNELAAQAVAARREALSSMGGLAGNMRTQQFGEQERIAQAKDLINQFNMSNRQDVAGRNLAQKQAFLDNKTNIANEQERANKGLIQQNFQNQMNKAQAIGNARTGQANAQLQSAQQTLQAGQQQAQGISNIGSGVSNGLAAVGSYVTSQNSAAASAAEAEKNRKLYAAANGIKY